MKNKQVNNMAVKESNSSIHNNHVKDAQIESLTPKEQYDAKKREKKMIKKAYRAKQATVKKSNSMFIWIGVILVVTIGGFFVVKSTNSLPFLPPISTQNHVESSPVSHILTTPIPDREQRHMLEHSDGNGLPGIIIQYNCDAYDCALNLIEKLTTLTEEYPENVYLAPNIYDGKIILTKMGRREILEEYNAEIIKDFINN